MPSKTQIKISTLFYIFILLICAHIAFAQQFNVIRVSDGDTLKAESESFEITIRLVGIDAPETSKKKNEPGQPFSQRAKTLLQMLVLN